MTQPIPQPRPDSPSPTLWPMPSAGDTVGLLCRFMDFWPFGGGPSGAGFSFLQTNGDTNYGTFGSILVTGVVNTPQTVYGAEGILTRFTSAAGAQIILTGGLGLSLTATPSQAAAPRRYLRYACEYDYYKGSNVATRSLHGWNTSPATGQLNADVNALGMELQSESGVAGGAWRLMVRRTQGGGMSTLATTAIPGAGRHRWRWDYVDGPTKRLDISCDGAVVISVTNPADYPAYVGYVTGETFPRFRAGTAAGAAGTVDYITRWLYEIRQGEGW